MEDRADVVLEKVTKVFGDVVAVDDISLNIRKGEFFSLLGPSGCGKTTTLRIIGGFERPTNGKVYVGGQLMNDVPAYERPVNTVFQSYALFPHLTVQGNIAFGLKLTGMGKAEIEERVRRVLDLVDLPGFGDRKPSQLSGGQRQRVALARSLVLEPTVLLLDEPLGALDLRLRKQMQVELKNLQEKLKITFLYVTHDQEEALAMSDRIGVMNNGRLEQVANAEDIYERPKTRFVAGFIGETNVITGRKGVSKEGDHLEVEGLVIEIPRTSAPRAEGDDVSISIRPEKISMGNSLQLSNCFPAKIVDEIYKGSFSTFIMELENGLRIRVERQMREMSSNFAIGDQVVIGWAPESCIILED
ncbi:MAG: ABC transporter ATP-binding protein [Theionarchaea archaeon]|nr:ABC transporter ATP-binding protein [Theionarchaea archaeon]